jgi:putative transcriptional regulator
MRNKLRELRESTDRTQEELGEELGITRQSVISIETGRYSPSLALAIRIAQLFETRVEEVFLLDDPEPADAASTQ